MRDTTTLGLAMQAMRLLRERVGPPLTTTGTLIVSGEFPESIALADGSVHLVHIARDSDSFQIAGQLAHELFHRWATGPRAGGWIHELLAELFRLQFLRTVEMSDYADLYEADAWRTAALLTCEEMRNCGEFDRPAGYYGRALVTGLMLRDAVGDEALRRLTLTLDKSGRPDLEQWMSDLGASSTGAVRQIIGI